MGSFSFGNKRRRFPWQGIVFFVCIVIVAGVGAWLSTSFFATPTPSSSVAVVDVAPRARRFLDGVWVDPDLAQLPSIGVMIENFIDARPEAGVARSQLVFEAPVEAGITRFLVLYGVPDAGSEIGPVRSLRPYYLDWAKDVGAAIAHVGGSENALKRAQKEYANFNIDQFFEGGSFWRTKARAAPHNVYTTVPLLRDVLRDRSVISPSNIPAWTFVDDPPLEIRPEDTQKIVLPFSTDPYTVTWTYDRLTNTYGRAQRGAPHTDADGTEIRAKNIVVLPTTVKILDQVGRRAIDMNGTGSAIIFRDGTRIDGRWERRSGEQRLRFIDRAGKPLALTAGTTWVEVFPKSGGMEYNGVKEKFSK